MTNVVGMALRLIAVVKAGVGRFLALDESRLLDRARPRPGLLPGARRRRRPARGAVPGDLPPRRGRVRCRPHRQPDRRPARDRGRDRGPCGGLRRRMSPDRCRASASSASSTSRASPTRPCRSRPGSTRWSGRTITASRDGHPRLRAVFTARCATAWCGPAPLRPGSRSASPGGGCCATSASRSVPPSTCGRCTRPTGRWCRRTAPPSRPAGRDVPPWVERLFGITGSRNWTSTSRTRKIPVFLLGEKPARRSAVLSIGREAGLIRDMQALQRERVTEDQRTIREGEREIARLRESLSALDGLDALAATLRGLHERPAGSRGAATLRDRAPWPSGSPAPPASRRRRRPRPRLGGPAGAGGRGRSRPSSRRGAQP